MDERYEMTKLYSAGELTDFYSKYICTLAVCPYEVTYLNPKDINVVIPEDRTWEEAANRDQYLMQWKENKIDLATDILQHGSYFPLIVYKEDGKYYALEGMHRVESIHLMKDWNLEIFSIIVPKDFYKSQPNMESFNLKIYFPVFNVENYWHWKNFGHHLKGVKGYPMEKDGTCIKTCETIQDWIDAMFIWHKFLRHALFKYQLTSGNRIPSAQLINTWRENNG